MRAEAEEEGEETVLFFVVVIVLYGDLISFLTTRRDAE